MRAYWVKEWYPTNLAPIWHAFVGGIGWLCVKHFQGKTPHFPEGIWEVYPPEGEKYCETCYYALAEKKLLGEVE